MPQAWQSQFLPQWAKRYPIAWNAGWIAFLRAQASPVQGFAMIPSLGDYPIYSRHLFGIVLPSFPIIHVRSYTKFFRFSGQITRSCGIRGVLLSCPLVFFGTLLLCLLRLATPGAITGCKSFVYLARHLGNRWHLWVLKPCSCACACACGKC